MNDWCEGVGSGARSWIGPIDDIKGRLRDTAGVEERGPIGGGSIFGNRVACYVSQLNGIQRPATSSGERFKFLGRIDSASQSGSLEVVSTEIERSILARGAGAEADTSGVKTGKIV